MGAIDMVAIEYSGIVEVVRGHVNEMEDSQNRPQG
jgi:hypothetical protein